MDRAIHRRGNGYALSRDLAPRLVRIAGLTPLGRETVFCLLVISDPDTSTTATKSYEVPIKRAHG
jgi:hypothetical protein